MRWALFVPLVLSACRAEFEIQRDRFVRAMTLPVEERVRTAVRALDERDRLRWVRVSNLVGARQISDGTVVVMAARHRKAAKIALGLGLASAGLVAVSAGGLYVGLNDLRDASGVVYTIFGLIGTAVGVVGMIASTIVGVTELRMPDTEVKPGRADMAYLP